MGTNKAFAPGPKRSTITGTSEGIRIPSQKIDVQLHDHERCPFVAIFFV